jgi:fructose-specific phosphotransferase system IIB component
MKIVAITGCAGGIAHTYMAAEGIKKGAKNAGDTVRVEIQGSLGVEDRLTQEEIDNADLVIFAANINIEGKGRFDSKNPILIEPGEFVSHADKALEKCKKEAGLVH